MGERRMIFHPDTCQGDFCITIRTTDRPTRKQVIGQRATSPLKLGRMPRDVLNGIWDKKFCICLTRAAVTGDPFHWRFGWWPSKCGFNSLHMVRDVPFRGKDAYLVMPLSPSMRLLVRKFGLELKAHYSEGFRTCGKVPGEATSSIAWNVISGICCQAT